MADQKAYRAKTATFAAVALLPLQDMSVDEGGDTTDLKGDANSNVQAVFVDGIASEVTIKVSDFALGSNASLEIGDIGSLAIVWEQRADGRGAATSPNKTETYANAVLKSKPRSASGEGGKGDLSFVFRCPGVSVWT